MTRQIKATQFSLLVHAMFFLAAVTISQHTPPVRLPVALDFSILQASGPPEAGPPQAVPASPPASKAPAPVKKKNMPKPVAKKSPPPVVKKKPVEEQKTPVETVPVAASSPQMQPQGTTSSVSTSNVSAAAASAATPSASSAQGESARGGGGGIYTVGQLDGPLAAVAKAPPVYPPAAKRRNIEGWIKVKFVVDEQGQVDKVAVLDADPEGVFEQAVLRCISGWRFRPGTKGGVAVKALVEQTITFKLEG
jgi:protein TonB